MRKEELGKVRKHEKHSENKIFIIYKDNQDNFTIFFGSKLKALQANLKTNFEKEYYIYENEFSIIINENSQENEYIGEKITFKKKFTGVNEEFVFDLFNSINNVLKKGFWISLYDALDQISELIDNKEKNKLENVIKGYIGEMAFVKTLLTNGKKDLAKMILEGYQKKANKKHDFNFPSSRTKLEVKSTSGEWMDFIIKFNQQKTLNDTELYYIFLKYDFTQKTLGISLKQMIDDIYKELGPNCGVQPNHLIIFSEKHNFKNYFIDLNSIEYYILNSKILPKFIEESQKKYITDIKYKINIVDFINENIVDYNNQLQLEELKNKIEGQ